MVDPAASLYRTLSVGLGQSGSPGPWSALRWVQRANGSAPLRLGFDPDAACLGDRLPAHLVDPASRARVPVQWVESRAAARAHGWLRPENLDHSSGHGTLGAIMRSRSPDASLFAVTAGHVLAGDPLARFGNRVALRQAFPPVDIEGTLADWSPDLGSRDRDALFDASRMALAPQALDGGVVDQMAWPLGWADAPVGTRVFLLTRHHRMPARVTGRISSAVDAGDPPQRYFLHDVISYQVDSDPVGGDSGAPLWDESERLIGLHVGAAPPGSDGNAVASPIGRVLDWSGCDLVLRNEPLQTESRQPLPAPAVRPAAPAGIADGSSRAIDTLARTVWGEARGEPDADAGMRAVAHVVLNRRDHPGWWGGTVEDVCLKPWQFSCWNENDPNRVKLLAVGPGDASFALALGIAGQLVRMATSERVRADTTGGATHYYARSIQAPAWAARATFTVRIGNHLFYRDVA